MQRYRCLVVEDSKTMRSMLAESLLRIPGMEVVEADNGLAGIRALAAGQFDLVLTDVNMPVMDGYEAMRIIKAQHPEIPIIAQTAYTLSEDRNKCMKAGFNDYISKPINRVALFRLVSENLS